MSKEVKNCGVKKRNYQNLNWMIRLFALMDKRLGKRRLIKLKEVINSYPVMLKKFTKLE